MKPYQDPSKEVRRRKLRIAITYALTTPPAAAILAITIVVSLLTRLYWFLPVGLAFYAAFVWWTLRDEEQIHKVIIEELYPERSADLRKLRGKYASIMQEALDDRKRIEKAVSESPQAIQRALADTLEQVGAITDNIYEISYKSQSLEESLGPVDEAEEQKEAARLRQAIERTDDPYLKKQYEGTLETKLELLENLTKIRNALERWHAQLQRAATTLDNLYSQVLMIRSAEIRNLTEATDVVSQSLRQQVEELRLTSEAMDEVFSKRSII
jgi:hypothetical protein